MMDIDVGKGETRCLPNAKLGMDKATKFSDQVSDTTSSRSDIDKFSNNNNISPCGDESVITFPNVDICTKDITISSVGNSNNDLGNSKNTLTKQSEADSKHSKNFGLPSSKETIKDEKAPLTIMGLQSAQPVHQDENSNNNNNTGSGNVSSNLETGKIGPADISLSPIKKTDSDMSSNTIKALSTSVVLNGQTAKQNSPGDGAVKQITTNATNSNEFIQQNHVFVFSTQLANKGADAVLCGQFPTIIDYHRTQPTTILFLEEFLKNPTKTTKLQRQYSLNIMNPMQSVCQQQYWSNEGHNLNGLQPQIQRLPLRNVGINSASKDNTSWNSTSVLDNQNTNDFNPLQTAKRMEHEGKLIEKSNVSSLQGVKVPDENLTPQQRQHREEQLAKLKKMNKFLFPENEIQDFQSQIPRPFNSSDSISNCLETGKKSVGISSEIITINTRNMSGNILKSGQQNVENGPSIGLRESILPASRKGPQTNFSNELQNIKSGAGYISTTNSSTVSNFSTLKLNQCNDQTVEALNSKKKSILNNISLPQNDGSNISPQTSWKKLQSSSFPDELNCETQQKDNNQATLFPGPSDCQQNLIDSPVGTNMPSILNRNNNGAPPPYQQTAHPASLPPVSPSNISSNKIPAESSLTTSNTSNVNVSNTIMDNYRVPLKGGTNYIPRLNSNSMVEITGQKPNMDNLHNFKSTPGILNNNFGMGFSTCNIPPHNIRQNIHRMPPTIGRRMDNIPLNPNLRLGQSNNSMNFDPISSLTQMSQQLTGVGLGARGGASNNSMNINQSEQFSTEQSKLISNSNCTGMTGGFLNAAGRAARHFPPDMSGLMCDDAGTIISNKMCPPNMSFNFGANSAVTGVGLRESVMGCNEIGIRHSTRRGNFDNFNVSSNVNVRVSAPNTIQYMPARSQNVNNVPMTQNVEMFQGYSNTHAMNNNVGSIGNTLGGTMNNNDMTTMNTINMFGNCNTEFQQNELADTSNLITNNDFMNLPP